MENKTLALVEEAYGIKIIPELYGNGHINKTYVTESRPRLIVQEINTNIFKDPVAMMENIVGVTQHLGKKLAANGKNPDRYTLTVVPAKDGAMYKTFDGKFYRAYLFIEDSQCFDMVTPETLRLAGLAFGEFGKHLSDYPAETLSEVIPHFHDTPSRYADLLAAIIEQGAYEFALYEGQCSCLEKFKVRISAVVCVGYCCPNGHYARVEQRVALAQAATKGKAGALLFVKAQRAAYDFVLVFYNE